MHIFGFRVRPAINPLGSLALASLAALLAACSPASDQDGAASNAANTAAQAAPAASSPAPQPAPAERPTILLRDGGILIETPGHGAALAFGQTTPDEAAAALAAFGEARRDSNPECPAGPLDFMDWDNGLQLIFQDGRLVGWWASDKARGLATAAGLRPGSPRSALGKTRIEDVSIGKVFTIDGVNGVLDDPAAAKVDAMWAGTACIFH